MEGQSRTFLQQQAAARGVQFSQYNNPAVHDPARSLDLEALVPEPGGKDFWKGILDKGGMTTGFGDTLLQKESFSRSPLTMGRPLKYLFT